MITLKRLVSIFLIFLLFSSSANAVDLNGIVNITEKDNPARPKEYNDVVVYFIPSGPVGETQSDKVNKEIIMKGKDFMPRVMPVMVGTEVSFPNFDPILHNAFSTSRDNEFDLGLYGDGKSAAHIFDKPGLVRVYCNVHHHMVAYVLTFDSPYFTKINEQGEFVLKDLPATSGDLFVWHPRAKPYKERIDITISESGRSYNLELTKRRVPQHNNKEGISYREAKKNKYRR